MKKILFSIIRTFFGFIFSLFGKRVLKNKITIFNFHEVSHDPSEFLRAYDLNINPDVFNFQINFIVNNFNVITPDDLIKGNLKENSALITFDDGFKGVFQNAIPILTKHNASSVIFLNMSVIKGETFWAGIITYLCKYEDKFINHLHKNKILNQNKALFLYCDVQLVNSFIKKYGIYNKRELLNYIGEFASFEELKIADEINGVHYGNHLDNHYVSLNLKNAELIDSYKKNEKLLSKFHSKVNLFAFPFGQLHSSFSKEQISILHNYGAQKTFSTHSLINNENSTFLDRIPLFEIDNTIYKLWFRIFYRSCLKFFTKK